MAESLNEILRERVLDKIVCGHELNKEETDYYNLHKDESDFNSDLQFLKDIKGPLSIENKTFLKSQLIKKEEQIVKSKKTVRLRPALAMAASLVALIAVSFLFWTNQSSTELFDSHYDLYPSIINPVVKGEQTANTLLEEAMVDYQESNFQQASNLLKSISTKSDTVLFYLALSQIELNQAKAAQQNLSLIDDPSSRFYKESQWYSALLLLRQEQDVQAKAQLQTIVNSQQHPYQEEAASLLRKMK